MKELTHIDLFSGIGGFALAARWAGIKTVQFVEIDPFCQKVLQKNFKGVPIHDDIKTFKNTRCERQKISEEKTTGIEQCSEVVANAERIGQVGSEHNKQSRYEEVLSEGHTGTHRPFLLTGGFPCQPFSCAGKRRGKEDDRYLWEEMLRVIKEFKPTWIIGENVNGIRSMEFQDGVSELEGDTAFQEDGNGDYTNVLDGICDSLEAIGYEVQPVIIPACAVNAPHRRDRVWIVAHSTSDRLSRGRQGITVEEGLQSGPEHAGELEGRPQGSHCHAPDTEPEGLQGHFQQQTEPTGAYCRCLADCHAPDTSNQGLQRGEETGNTSINGEESRNELPGGFPGWEEPWLEVATRLCRVDARVSNRVDRLKSLGNAVVPQIPYLIMKAILEVENVKP